MSKASELEPLRKEGLTIPGETFLPIYRKMLERLSATDKIYNNGHVKIYSNLKK